MSKPITFITGNPGKAEQLAKYLGIPVTNHKLDLVEIQSVDLNEVIKHKVMEAYKILGNPVLVDDVALSFSALGNLPGPFIKHFIAELGNDGVCKLMESYSDKSAIATVAIGYFDGQDLQIFSGVINGKISDSPKGDGGFGWDQIFIPDGFHQTRSEMNEADYDNTNPRKLALEKLETYLSKIK